MRGGFSFSRLFSLLMGALLLCAPADLPAASTKGGRLTGQVSNRSGDPLEGARVWIVSQTDRRFPVRQLKTNPTGFFEVGSLPAGLYAVRISLESFEPHVESEVRLQTGEQRRLNVRLRAEPRLRSRKERENEDWLWVLRARTSVRSVLHFAPPARRPPEGNPQPGQRGRVEVTSTAGPGDRLLSGVVQTRFAHALPLGQAGQLIVVGGAAYRDAPGAVLESRWRPQGPSHGPEFMVGLVEQLFSPGHLARGGQTTTELRVFRAGFTQEASLPAGVQVDYGVSYVAARLGDTAAALEPTLRLSRSINGSTLLHYTFSTATPNEISGAGNPSAGEKLARSLADSHSMPRLSRRGGALQMEQRAHQEVGVEHRFADGRRLVLAVFHDRVRNAVLAGRGNSTTLDSSEFLANPGTSGFFLNGGDYAATGMRVAYLFRWLDRLDAMVGYANGEGLAATDGGAESDQPLQNRLRTKRSHALTARVGTDLPGSNTQVRMSYRWLSAPLLTLLDEGDDGDTGARPYLNLTLQQPIPSFFFIPKGLAVLADVGNPLDDGSTELTLSNGQSIRLAPLRRSFRGGVIYQF